jgi:hypothetical protein
MPYLDERWMARETIRYLGDAALERPASARQLVREFASALAVRYGAGHLTRSATGRDGGEE